MICRVSKYICNLYIYYVCAFIKFDFSGNAHRTWFDTHFFGNFDCWFWFCLIQWQYFFIRRNEIFRSRSLQEGTKRSIRPVPILGSVGIRCEDSSAEKLIAALKGKSLKEVIAAGVFWYILVVVGGCVRTCSLLQNCLVKPKVKFWRCVSAFLVFFWKWWLFRPGPF